MKEFQDGYKLFYEASSLRGGMLLLVARALNDEFNEGLKTMIVNRSPDMLYKMLNLITKNIYLNAPREYFEKMIILHCKCNTNKY